MTIAGLATPTIANAGATLVAASSGALVSIIVRLSNGEHIATVAIVVAFAGVAVGTALAYVGRPPSAPISKA